MLDSAGCPTRLARAISKISELVVGIMGLSREDVAYVASLARLKLSEEETLRMQEQLSSILEHITVIDRLDTSAIPPTAQVIALHNVMRPDEATTSLPRDAVLANAPRQADGFFEVLAILSTSDDEAGS